MYTHIHRLCNSFVGLVQGTTWRLNIYGHPFHDLSSKVCVVVIGISIIIDPLRDK